jgi:hypothetical protein
LDITDRVRFESLSQNPIEDYSIEGTIESSGQYPVEAFFTRTTQNRKVKDLSKEKELTIRTKMTVRILVKLRSII